MKFIMVIIICFGADCKALWENTFNYNTAEECIQASAPVKSYMMDVYPTSSGEIYCMTKEEFDDFYQDIESNKQLTLPKNPI